MPRRPRRPRMPDLSPGGRFPSVPASVRRAKGAFSPRIFVLIIGPKGTGKTSLVREYAKRKYNSSKRAE